MSVMKYCTSTKPLSNKHKVPVPSTARFPESWLLISKRRDTATTILFKRPCNLILGNSKQQH